MTKDQVLKLAEFGCEKLKAPYDMGGDDTDESAVFAMGAQQENARLRPLIEALADKIEGLQKLADSQIAYATRLECELKAARTLDALLSDNGQVCELHDDVEALEVKVAILAESNEKLVEALRGLDCQLWPDENGHLTKHQPNFCIKCQALAKYEERMKGLPLTEGKSDLTHARGK